MYSQDPISQDWKTAFFQQYGLPFDVIEDKIDEIPTQLQQTIDRRATVHVLYMWNTGNNATSRAKIIGNANKIIKAWNENEVNLFKDGSRSLMWYHELEHEYAKGLLHF